MNGSPVPSESVAQRDARVREGAGIDNQKADSVRRCPLDALDELMLRIALERDQLVPCFPGYLDGAFLDGLQRLRSVDAGFTTAEQVQIRAVQQQHSSHLSIPHADRRPAGAWKTVANVT